MSKFNEQYLYFFNSCHLGPVAQTGRASGF